MGVCMCMCGCMHALQEPKQCKMCQWFDGWCIALLVYLAHIWNVMTINRGHVILEVHWTEMSTVCLCRPFPWFLLM